MKKDTQKHNIKDGFSDAEFHFMLLIFDKVLVKGFSKPTVQRGG